jgi:hypothetical protein
MRFDVQAFTDVAGFAFYDPAAVPHLLCGAVDLMQARDDEVAGGRLLAVEARSDGGARARIYVGDTVPDEMRTHQEDSIKDCLLRVPSGRLVFSGMEDLWTQRPEQVKPEAFRSSTGEESRVPPGNYLAEAWSIDWGDRLEKLRDEIKGPADRVFDRLIGPLMGLVLACTFLGAPVAGAILALEYGWASAWTLIKYTLLAHAVFWPLVWLYVKISGAHSPEAVWQEEALLKEHPEIILVLTRLPDGADLSGRKGGLLHSGFGDSPSSGHEE